MDMRDRFISTIYRRAVDDRRIVFLSCEYGAPSLDRFRSDLPEQFINAGISEQNAISVAAGLAKEGKQVIVYSIASFITLRCLEQIKLDLCTMGLPVTLVAVGPGYAYGVDGPTHHCTEDLALMRAMGAMTIYSPSDDRMVAMTAEMALAAGGPVYCRLDRGDFPNLGKLSAAEKENGFRVFGGPARICLVTTGALVRQALDVAAQSADRGIELAVVDLFRIKPLAQKPLAEVLSRFDFILTLEEHTLNGGLGSLVAEVVVDYGLKTRLRRMGIDDHHLYAYGRRERLKTMAGIDNGSLAEAILEAAGKCRNAA